MTIFNIGDTVKIREARKQYFAMWSRKHMLRIPFFTVEHIEKVSWGELTHVKWNDNGTILKNVAFTERFELVKPVSLDLLYWEIL